MIIQIFLNIVRNIYKKKKKKKKNIVETEPHFLNHVMHITHVVR